MKHFVHPVIPAKTGIQLYATLAMLYILAMQSRSEIIDIGALPIDLSEAMSAR